jgi:hypothetical protein
MTKSLAREMSHDETTRVEMAAGLGKANDKA